MKDPRGLLLYTGAQRQAERRKRKAGGNECGVVLEQDLVAALREPAHEQRLWPVGESNFECAIEC